MVLQTLLMQPLTAREQTISLSGGPLELGADLIIDPGGLHPERCVVRQVFSPTQAAVVRGAHGTTARAYPIRTLVDISIDGIEQRVLQPVTEEQELPTIGITARQTRKIAPDVNTTFKAGACPTCGCTGDHSR